MGLIKNIALFSQLLMMREVEIVYWAALNTPEDIQEVIKENSQKDGRESQILQGIRSRLMMTAYYTKSELSSKDTEVAVQEFFNHHFGVFVDKHREWYLLYEPPEVTPQLLCETRASLMEIHKHYFKRTETANKKDMMQ